MKRTRFTRRDALKLLPAGAVAAAGAGVVGAHLAPSEAQVAGECRMCVMHCGYIATTRGDTIVRVRGDDKSNTRGFLCEHGLAIPDVVHARARLRTPLKRDADGVLRPASWEQALDEIGAHLAKLRAEAPEALAVQTGWPFVRHPMIPLLHRFCRAFGTPNLATVASLCEASGRMGRALVFGTNYAPNLQKTNSVLVWGANPLRTAPPWGHLVTDVKRRGGKLVVIDPVKRDVAERADEYLAIRPGTDAALAACFIKLLVESGRHKKDFVDDNCAGLDALLASVAPWDAARTAAVTGVPADQIARVVDILATQGPLGVWDGLGVEHHGHGVDTVRLIASLVALTGSFGAQNVIDAARTHHDDDALPIILRIDQHEPRPPAPQRRPVGADEYPLFCAVHRQAQASLLPRAILEEKPYALRALLVLGANPALTTPDALTLRRAYDKLDLLVVVDPFLSETAALADWVLPAATFAEQPRVDGRGPPIVEPRGEARPDVEILHALAERIGIGAFFPWHSYAEAFAEKTTPTVDEWAARDARPSAGAAGARFPTASGKVELSSSLLPRFGLPAVPVVDAAAAAAATPELTLVTGPRQRAFINSQFHEIARIADLVEHARAEMHPDTAAAHGVVDGARVRVSTASGAAVFVARITRDVVAGVIVVPHGWQKEQNANRLTSAAGLDPISGFPRLRALPCTLLALA